MSSKGLEKLRVSERPEREIPVEELVEVLEPYLGISENGEFVFHDAYYESPVYTRVIVVLLGEWAKYHMELADNEWLQPEEISRLGDLHIGEAYPRLRKLEQSGTVENQRGKYRIPPRNFQQIRNDIRLD